MPDQTDSHTTAADTPAEAAPARRRRAASRPAGPPVGVAAEADTGTGSADAPEAAPARRRTRKTAASEAAATDTAAETGETAAPARRRATRKAAAAPAAEEAAADDAAPAPARRRATRKAAAPAPAAEETEAVQAAPEAASDDAAPARTRRRATRKAAAPAPAAEETEAAEAAPEAASDDAAPARTRRRATRKAAAPAAAPEETTDAAEEPVADDAAPARTRRRATRKATAPAGSPAVAEEAPADAEAPVEEAAPAEDAAPARTRRRATRKATAPAGSPAVAEEAPAEAEAPAEEPAGRTARRTRKKAAPAATFSASGGDGSRRLKPGALAPQPEAADASAASGPATAYTGKALRDGDGWAVEVDDAYEIRGYGATPEDAAAQAVAALADAFGIAAESVTLDVRTEEAPARGRRRVVQPPTAVFQPPVFGAPAPAAEEVEEAEPEAEAEEHEGGSSRRRRRRRGGAAADAAATEAAESAEAEAEEPEAEAEGDADGEDRPSSRRRRRGGRRRRRGEAAEHDESASGDDEDEDESQEGDEAESADEHEDEHPQGGGSGSTSSRRRRRRRRRGGDSGADDTHGSDVDDPERTVVKVREPRQSHEPLGTGADQVQSIKGSTRLEAKKQRRREGREQGRRRVPIITEAEFLARREAVERVMVVRQNGERTQIGVLEDNVLVEHYVNKEQATSYVGNVYLGKVQNVLPSMEAAFVDIGKGRNAVLYAGEVNFEALGLSGGPRRIESALKSGQPVLVQVTKDPIGHKGARLTSQVSLPGRYLVYVPEGSMTGISRKLPDTERARLKTILKKIVPEDAGVIVRTAAEGASEDELRRDVERLQAQWDDIQRKAKSGGGSNAPTLLYGEPDMTVRVVRDIFNEDFSKVIVSGDEAWGTIHDYVSHVAPDLADRLSRWTSEVDVFATYRIDEQLLKALDRKVWLPSGGSLVIDKTEAMVVVDVNTGKFTGQGGNLEETVTRNNLEAAEEIVRQLRLRDLGGIVVVDFIDMVLESNRDLVMRRLLECLGRDRTKHQVAEVTSLGLVQMTRKRVGQGLLESFSETCVHCNGRGVIVHMDQATTTGGGGGKRKRRGGKAAGGEGHEHIADVEVETEAEAEAEELPELEPIEVGESDLVPAVGDPEEEWFGSAAEAEAAANSSRGRNRRRGARQEGGGEEDGQEGCGQEDHEEGCGQEVHSPRRVAPSRPEGAPSTGGCPLSAVPSTQGRGEWRAQPPPALRLGVPPLASLAGRWSGTDRNAPFERW
ncbi:Rne/Rng family ribonuclease [Actinacidiphila bryophytorum]|uniref:Rne/Rng family ribonuclease n=1 Tax=Actinacidiphila bryophytorum TaxID=1436133 RepID=UPI001980B886|nr:Rne/Rng family ribonuclease [Actinacidiphila bryophytorum]MBN6542739.1 ribonuclease E/G [Actinacidiphila bryophytorum]